MTAQLKTIWSDLLKYIGLLSKGFIIVCKIFCIVFCIYAIIKYETYKMSLNIPLILQQYKPIALFAFMTDYLSTFLLIIPVAIVGFSFYYTQSKIYNFIAGLIAVGTFYFNLIFIIKNNADIEAVKFKLFTVYHAISLQKKVDIFILEFETIVNNAYLESSLIRNNSNTLNELFNTKYTPQVKESLKTISVEDIPAYAKHIYKSIHSEIEAQVAAMAKLDHIGAISSNVSSNASLKTFGWEYITLNGCLKTLLIGTCIAGGIYLFKSFMGMKAINHANVDTHEASAAVHNAAHTATTSLSKAAETVNTATNTTNTAVITALDGINNTQTLSNLNLDRNLTHLYNAAVTATTVLNDHSTRINKNTQFFKEIEVNIETLAKELNQLKQSLISSTNPNALQDFMNTQNESITTLEINIRKAYVSLEAQQDKLKILLEYIQPNAETHKNLDEKFSLISKDLELKIRTLQQDLDSFKTPLYDLNEGLFEWKQHVNEWKQHVNQWKIEHENSLVSTAETLHNNMVGFAETMDVTFKKLIQSQAEHLAALKQITGNELMQITTKVTTLDDMCATFNVTFKRLDANIKEISNDLTGIKTEVNVTLASTNKTEILCGEKVSVTQFNSAMKGLADQITNLMDTKFKDMQQVFETKLLVISTKLIDLEKVIEPLLKLSSIEALPELFNFNAQPETSPKEIQPAPVTAIMETPTEKPVKPKIEYNAGSWPGQTLSQVPEEKILSPKRPALFRIHQDIPQANSPNIISAAKYFWTARKNPANSPKSMESTEKDMFDELNEFKAEIRAELGIEQKAIYDANEPLEAVADKIDKRLHLIENKMELLSVSDVNPDVKAPLEVD